MICPNCGSNMSDKKKRCERCGQDMIVYSKIYKASNLYYNNGLARAKVRDLSGAVTALRSSLELNKLNTNARNLLGLIFYEMGETVAALSEWVISRHFQPENNDADEYIGRLQSNLTRLDSLNQAIKRYNTALTLAKQGSDDLSIIQLKKVIALNPHFIRAYQLVSLLHIKAGEKEKAKKNLLKAAKIDVSNTTILRYLQELEVTSSMSKDFESNPEAETNTSGAIMPISSYREDKPNIMAFVNLVIGVAIGLAVMAFLVFPTIKNNQVDKDNSGYIDFGAELAEMEEKDKTIGTLRTENEKLQSEIDQLETQISNTPVPEDNSDLYTSLFQAVELYYVEVEKPKTDQDFMAIAELLESTKEAELEDEQAVKVLTRLREATYPGVADKLYDIGHDLYSDEKYEEALVELKKAIIYDPTDVNAIYFVARTYHRLEDKDNASIYYNIVITDYPDSSRVKDSKDFLDKLKTE